LRYRALSSTSDYTFGSGSTAFLVNSPACVAQAILTTLRLCRGEWFLDTTVGVPYNTKILGKNTAATRDTAIRTAILGVQGVTGIVAYQSQLSGRNFTVNAQVSTLYGPVTITAPFGPGVPPPRIITTDTGAIITGPGGEIITY
jgi:hypothetical protein